MTCSLPISERLFDEMHGLVVASLAGDMSHDQRRRLEQLIQQNDQLRNLYLKLIFESSILLAWAGHGDPSETQSNQPIPSNSSPLFPAFFHYTLTYFSSGWPLAYFIATVIFAIGAVIGSNIYVSHHVQVATVSPLPLAGEGLGVRADSDRVASSVGRITGMVDCKWAKKGTDPVYRNGPEGAGHKRGLSPFSPEAGGRQQGAGNANLPSPGTDRRLVGGRGAGNTNLPSPFGRGAGGEGSSGSGHPSSLIPYLSSPVSLSDTFHLASGLLEITYDTGAKVILQGPVTYEVDSADGGFLSVGKLTARVEKQNHLPSPAHGRGAGGEGGEEVASGQGSVARNSSPQPLAPSHSFSPEPLAPSPSASPESLAPSPSSNPLSPLPSPLFSVKTPTATVTDLGTEFGVEVDQDGGTVSSVFVGSVRVQPTEDAKGEMSTGHVLHENQSARVDRRDGNQEIVLLTNSAASGFVRCDEFAKLKQPSKPDPLKRWQAYSRQLRNDPALVAYYPFESVGDSSWLLQNAAVTGSALDGEIQGPLWTSGRFPGKLALRFRGPGTPDKVVLPEPQRFNFTTPFTIAVWFQASPFPPGSIPALITRGRAWRIQRYGEDTNYMNVSTNAQMINGQHYGLPSPRTEVTDGQWHHIVAVLDPREDSHHKRLYMDGRLEGEVEVPTPLEEGNDTIWLGQSSVISGREFQGLIDEVAIIARAMSADEIETMYHAGKPANTSVKSTNNDRPKEPPRGP